MGSFLGGEDPLEEGMGTHSSILSWRIPGGLQSIGSRRVGHNWSYWAPMHSRKRFLWLTKVKTLERHWMGRTEVLSGGFWSRTQKAASPRDFTWGENCTLLGSRPWLCNQDAKWNQPEVVRCYLQGFWFNWHEVGWQSCLKLLGWL